MKSFILIIIFITPVHHILHSQPKNRREFRQVHIEVAGPGSLCSINYDFRTTGRRSGFGFKAGIGGTPLGVLGKSCNQGGLLTIPFGFNVLSKGKYAQFEWGGGAVLPFVGATKVYCGDNFKYGFFSDATDIYYYIMAGTRLYAKESRIVYRFFISPLFQKDFPVKFWGGTSIGMKF